MSEVTYTCDKCPRTFKLQEFYDKHKLVHDLKKQHVCQICGSVYGAAKGLEGHMQNHLEEKEEEKVDTSQNSPGPLNITFLNPRGVLAQASVPESSPSSVQSQEDTAKNGGLSGTGSYEVLGTSYAFLYFFVEFLTQQFTLIIFG